MKLDKYSMGVGDRFMQQGRAQLDAFMRAKKEGVTIIPVWNKSDREHKIIGTTQESTRQEADSAVRECGWLGVYFSDV